MAKTIRLTPKQEQALIWALNTFDDCMYDLDEDTKKDYEKAAKALAPIYAILESED